MKIMSTYSVKIRETHGAFKNTTEKYRQAVDYFIKVALKEWEIILPIKSSQLRQREIELLTHQTEKNANTKYKFDEEFYKFPSYLRRAAINEAIGKVSSYKSNLSNWQENPQGKEPGEPKAGRIYPAMYRDNCFVRTGTYTARLKILIKSRKECSPTLQKRGKNWYLDFAFEEKDCLNHAVNRIKKAQQHGARKIPRLWAKAKGLNQNIANLTANFIIDVAKLYRADVIVFEHLDLSGKKRGTKKQRLHLWKARSIQQIVEHKAHRIGMRISRICAWNTSRLAYDGSGYVERDEHNYSLCTFQSGKKYHCDLSASYNIGARYFIRELLKSLSVTVRLGVEAKVPQCSHRLLVS